VSCLAGVLMAIAIVATSGGPVAHADDEVDMGAGADLTGVDGSGESVGTSTDSAVPDLTVGSSRAQQPVRVRLTYYVAGGITFSGVRTGYGQTACSWNFPLWSRFRFANGETFVCTDRGHLGSSGWLDLWRRPDLARAYGGYATVELLP
jgi:hypothetical protein